MKKRNLNRSDLYKIARLWGDLRAIRKGTIVKRIVRRILGRIAGRIIWKLTK